jgi:hypothetical protein
MKKLLLALLISTSALHANAQKVYFVYIQSESQQPFFVKMDNRVISSAGSGYLILSKLKDSVYEIAVGFPMNKWPEYKFTISINKQDHGFLLKNFNEKGWGLFDLQSLVVQMGVAPAATIGINNIPGKNISPFNQILAKASDDPSLLENNEKTTPAETTTIEEVGKEKQVNNVIQSINDVIFSTADTNKEEHHSIINSGVKKDEQISNVKKDQQIETGINDTVDTVSYIPGLVKKCSESSTTEGYGLVFIDENGVGQNDTIRIVIPNPKVYDLAIENNVEKKEERKFLEIEDSITKKEEKVVNVIQAPVADSTAKSLDSKNKCNALAHDSDFFQLRKQMAAAIIDEEMIIVAKKFFDEKCFSSLQIKNLGVLFLNEETKYNFFTIAYSYVSDKVNFVSLQTDFKDEYYANRFRAMLRN